MNKRTLLLAAVTLAALAACSSGKSTKAGSPQPSGASASAAPSASATPNCNGEAPVWALARVKVYLVPGDRLYGKTKHGEYICRSQAHAQGYRPGRAPFHRHRHKGLFSD
jgi:hypothetical protein